jgi:hypothetical protein
MKLCITQHDIDHGEPCDGARCAVALAACRAFDVPLDSVMVSGNTVQVFHRDGTHSEHWLPEDAMRYIHVFDNEGEGAVLPWEFELETQHVSAMAGRTVQDN